MTLLASSLTAQPTAQSRSDRLSFRAIEDYISRSWHSLTRSNRDLARAAVDPKFQLAPNQRPVVYIPAKEDLNKIESSLRAQLSAPDFATIEVQQLPRNVTEIKQP